MDTEESKHSTVVSRLELITPAFHRTYPHYCILSAYNETVVWIHCTQSFGWEFIPIPFNMPYTNIHSVNLEEWILPTAWEFSSLLSECNWLSRSMSTFQTHNRMLRFNRHCILKLNVQGAHSIYVTYTDNSALWQIFIGWNVWYSDYNIS